MNRAAPTPKTRPAATGASRRGATLLVTLGILTVLSVIVISFFVAARAHRQTAAGQRQRLAARDHLSEGVYLAMRYVEESLTHPNFVSGNPDDGQYLTRQRLVPLNDWFGRDFSETNGFDDAFTFQSGRAFASPCVSNNPTVNLLSPAVLRLLPSAVTNGLALSPSAARPFRSGWLPLDLPGDTSVEWQLRAPKARVAFAAFDCSGLLDANRYLEGPTHTRPQRSRFTQADVTNWVARSQALADRLTALGLDLDPADSPFFHLSYDPDPDVYPLHYDCFETCGTLGTFAFASGPVINLNAPLSNLLLAAVRNAPNVIQEQSTYWKFNLNSLTNHLGLGTASSDDATPWYNHAQFRAAWLDPVTFLLEMMRHEEPDSLLRWPSSPALAWSIANYMDADRLPQVTGFPTDDNAEPELGTRCDYAVEDVPLINKVSVFNIFDPDAPFDNDYYEVDDTLSNHYAVAVELWYPFAPNPPPADSACYIGIYTNAADVTTTTNRPWTRNELRDWFAWNNLEGSNSVMRTLFYSWGAAYTAQVGPALDGHPLWTVVTNGSALWFTPAMTNHPSWPVADTNGAFALSDTPIWQAFYPETYESVTTNEAGVVSTNVFTYLNVTNAYVDWVSDSDGSTNRYLGSPGTHSPEPYPLLLWTNLTSGALSTNILRAVQLTNSVPLPFYAPGYTNLLLSLFADADGIHAAVSNEAFAASATVPVAGLDLSDADAAPPAFTLVTNLTATLEIIPVPPLPMPEDLGQALASLFALLPTNSLPALYTFLMLSPDEFTEDMWDSLLDYFNENPSILNRLMPSHQEPTLGNMTEEDRHALVEGAAVPPPEAARDNGTTRYVDKSLPPASAFEGRFWTVYPKRAVCFMEVLETAPPEGSTGLESEYTAITNYHPLGVFMQGSERPNTLWLRPAVTVRQASSGTDGTVEESDAIVDEALLRSERSGTQDTGAQAEVPVWGWTSVTNLYIADPRRNAYARNWSAFPEGKLWQDPDILNTTNLSTSVRELPFLHADAPFSSIGDIGHIYASYQSRRVSAAEEAEGEGGDTILLPPYDTLTFATRSGAALLDIFTLSATNAPRRGLVQANTPHAPVVRHLLADLSAGWTNLLDGGSADLTGLTLVRDYPDRLDSLASAYLDALTNAPLSLGWRSFADMLPLLSTNRLITDQGVWQGPDLHPMHDYTEDLLRGLVGKLSFRQSAYILIVAAQTLTPASTAARSVVLSDQRAAVTILRDTYTGRWVIHSWVWLTD